MRKALYVIQWRTRGGAVQEHRQEVELGEAGVLLDALEDMPRIDDLPGVDVEGVTMVKTRMEEYDDGAGS